MIDRNNVIQENTSEETISASVVPIGVSISILCTLPRLLGAHISCKENLEQGVEKHSCF